MFSLRVRTEDVHHRAAVDAGRFCRRRRLSLAKATFSAWKALLVNLIASAVRKSHVKAVAAIAVVQRPQQRAAVSSSSAPITTTAGW